MRIFEPSRRIDPIEELARDVALAREWLEEDSPRSALARIILGKVDSEGAGLRVIAKHDNEAGRMARTRLAALVKAGLIEPDASTPSEV
jgi:hypothetical protein